MALLRIVHFELSCASFAGEPSVPLFRRFYRLQSNEDWFTFEKIIDSISLPCYSFMPTSTYPKQWKNRFIFVYPSMISDSLPLRDPVAVKEDGVPPLSATEDMFWRKMYEHHKRAFNFPEGILAIGGLSPFYLVRPKAFYERKAIYCGVSYVVEGVVNQEMGGVLGGVPLMLEVRMLGRFWERELLLFRGGSPKGSEGSQNSLQWKMQAVEMKTYRHVCPESANMVSS
ncbi:hypothetical protein Hanom_Chr06g00548121 [Helianthus anomalus]